MNTLILVLFICLVVLCLVVWFARRQQQAQKPLVMPPFIDWDVANDVEIRDLVVQGLKIQAIKMYREQTGVGLKEAKDIIDYLHYNRDDYGDSKPKHRLEMTYDEGIRELLRKGSRAEAIIAYQKFTGVDVMEAEAEIARIEWEVSESKRHGGSTS